MFKKGKVIVTEVKQIANGAYQLTLTQDVVNLDNTVGVFMEGHTGINSPVQKRTAWQTVSAKIMAKKQFAVGDYIAEKMGIPQVNIQIDEFLVVGTWINSDGSAGRQQPKINPQTNRVLVVDGRPIYRNSRLVLKEAVDSFISHTAEVEPSQVTTPVAETEGVN